MQSVNWFSIAASCVVATDRGPTGHLNAPSKPAETCKLSGGHLRQGRTHCKPTRLKVSRAIRMDSVEPLIRAVPVHDAA